LVTVSDGERLKRGSLTAEERAKLAVEAWQLMDTQDMSSRSISRKWQAEGRGYISHVSITKWVNHVRRQEKILDLYESEQVRLTQLGKLEHYQEATRAAMDAGEIPFDVGMKLLLSLSKEISRLTDAAKTPTNRVEFDGTVTTHPDMALLEELHKVTLHEQEMEDLEANDGLMD
jgi:hypothetical protein